MRPTDFDRLAVIKLCFPFVRLSLLNQCLIYVTHGQAHLCIVFPFISTICRPNSYCLVTCLSFLPLSLHIDIIEITETFLVLTERDWVELHFQTRRDWLRKLKRIESSLNFKKRNSFFVTLFCLIFSFFFFFTLQNPCFLILHIMLSFIVFKKRPSLFYFLGLTKPQSLLKTPYSNLSWLEGNDKGLWWAFLLLSTTSQLWTGWFPMFWCSSSTPSSYTFLWGSLPLKSSTRQKMGVEDRILTLENSNSIDT